MQKLIYVANIRLPSELAHGLQIMKMCEAFSQAGNEVTLFVPRRFNRIKGNPFEYYNVQKNFKILRLPCLDLLPISPNRFFFLILSLSFYISAWFYSLFRKFDFVYSRDFLAGFFFKNLILEVHSLPKNSKRFGSMVRRRAKCLVVLTSFIRQRFIDVGVSQRRIIVAPDAVDLKEFGLSVSVDFAKKELGLPLNKKILGYVGSLKTMSMEKGVLAAILSLRHLEESYILYLVGGSPQDVNFYKILAKNEGLADRVFFTGEVRHNAVPQYLSAFDYLVAPFPENEHYSYFMSPLKIFEYMATGRPIIASDLPSIREILNENNSVLVRPGDDRELASAVRRLSEDPTFGQRIATGALVDIQKYTWGKRADKILSFIAGSK